MLKVKPKTKEQTIDFMLKYLSLGTYDKKFLSNLLQVNVTLHKPVTTNQAQLLNKIVSRYQKQFAKKEIDSKEIIELPWTLQPIESSPQYTNAHISLTEDSILVRTPYRKEFVKELKDLKFLTWNPETKTWTGRKAEFILKKIIDLVEKHFTNVNYCEGVKSIIDTLCEYESIKFWEPTLTCINGNLYVVAANAEVMDAITFIPLSTEPHILARLVRMGVNIDKDLIHESMHDIIKSDITIENFNVNDIINFLLLIKADLVMITEWYNSKNKDFVMSLANNLKANGIKVTVLRGKILITDKEKQLDLKKYEMPVNINIGFIKYTSDDIPFLAKNIFLVNNTPPKII